MQFDPSGQGGIVISGKVFWRTFDIPIKALSEELLQQTSIFPQGVPNTANYINSLKDFKYQPIY